MSILEQLSDEITDTLKNLSNCQSRLIELEEQNAGLIADNESMSADIIGWAQKYQEDMLAMQAELDALRARIEELESQPAPEPQNPIAPTDDEPEPEPEPEPIPGPQPEEIPAIAFDQHAHAWPPSAMTLPESGKWFRDPTFGAAMMRLPDGMRHVYSQLQPFSSDNRRMIVYNVNASRYGILSMDGSGDFEDISASYPRWAKDKILDVSRDRVTYDGGARLLGGADIFTAASAESPDAAEEHVAVVDSDEIVSVIKLFDLSTAYRIRIEEGINWVRVHPAGPDHGVIVQYNNSRTIWYSKDGSARAMICRNNRHSDLRIKGTTGFSYVYQEDYVEGAENALVKIDSTNIGKIVPLMKTQAWDRIQHNSCTGPDDVCSAGIQYQNKELKGEIWMVRQDGSIRRLCHHRSSIRDYWAQPHAAQSKDGRYVAFASDWGTEGHCGFVIDLQS